MVEIDNYWTIHECDLVSDGCLLLMNCPMIKKVELLTFTVIASFNRFQDGTQLLYAGW